MRFYFKRVFLEFARVIEEFLTARTIPVDSKNVKSDAWICHWGRKKKTGTSRGSFGAIRFKVAFLREPWNNSFIILIPAVAHPRVNLCDAFLRHFGRSIVSIRLRGKGRRALHVCASVCASDTYAPGRMWPRMRDVAPIPRRPHTRARMRQLGRCYVASDRH